MLVTISACTLKRWPDLKSFFANGLTYPTSPEHKRSAHKRNNIQKTAEMKCLCEQIENWRRKCKTQNDITSLKSFGCPFKITIKEDLLTTSTQAFYNIKGFNWIICVAKFQSLYGRSFIKQFNLPQTTLVSSAGP